MLSFAEGEVTKLRREFKLVMPGESAARLCAMLSAQLEGCLPPPTRIVSVYFDKPGYPLAHRAVHSPEDCLKVRTKEYSPDVGANGVQRVVLEVKRERHGVTQKRRVWVPREQLRSVMRGAGGLLPLIAGGRLLPVLARHLPAARVPGLACLAGDGGPGHRLPPRHPRAGAVAARR